MRGDDASLACGTRLLVVDDDRGMRRWLRSALEPSGVCVEEAASGWEALYCLSREGAHDLVLTDVRMPFPNGLGVVAMARAAGVATPFLVMTAFGEPGLRERVEQLGRAALLDKPFSVRDLVREARALLHRD